MNEDCPHCVFEITEDNCRGCFEGSHYKPKPITNADRIRSMTDEELATWIDRIQADAYERGMMETPIVDYPNIYSEWLDWLNEEAKGDTDENKA